MKAGISIAFASVCWLLTPRAAAPEAGEAATLPPPEAQARHWYGWQIWATDGALAVASIPGFTIKDAPPWTRLGTAGYLLGAPLVHGFHGHWLKALGSVGLRVVAVDVFALVGVGFTHCTDASWCDNTPVVLGVLTGIVAASAIDGGVLAYDAPPRPRVGDLDLSFTLGPISHGFQLGIVGRE